MISRSSGIGLRLGAGILLSLGFAWNGGDVARAADGVAGEPDRVVGQIETFVKHLTANIERELVDAVKKLEASETSKKISNEFRRSAQALGETVEQAGRKLKESFETE